MVLAKQESLDELRSTVQQAATCMERSSQDVQVLGQRMAAATELMSESVQENAQAVAMLAQVVEKLQGLVAARKSASVLRTKAMQVEESSEAVMDGKAHNIDGFSGCSSANAQGLSSTASAPHASETEETFEECLDGHTVFRNTDLCVIASSTTQWQGLVTSGSAASAPRTPAVHFEETLEESGGNADTANPRAAVSELHFRAGRVPGNAQPSPGHFTRRSRCPSYSSCSSSTSSSSSSSSSVLLESPVASRGRPTQPTFNSKAKPPSVSPRRCNDLPNGLNRCSPTQNDRHGSCGMGCLPEQKKKGKKKKK